jgi:hypothetical protein
VTFYNLYQYAGAMLSSHNPSSPLIQAPAASLTLCLRRRVVKTTDFVGQNVVDLLNFHASDPLLCGKPQELTSATITGVLGHVGLIGG